MVRYTGSPGRVHGGDAGGAGTCTWQATSPITRAHEYDALGRLALFTDKQLQVVAWTPVYVEDPYGDCPGCLILVDSTPTYDEVTLASASYAYDAVGNRAGAGVTVGTGNRLTAQGGWTITYDSVGNMTSRTAGSETLTYKWNALGQLDTVVAPGYTVTYGYDGLGRRVRKTVNGVATRYLVEGDRVLAELDQSWGVAATYAYRPGVDRPLAMQRGGATYYYTQDAQGNVTGLLNAAGSVVQQYHYTPYGEAQAGYGTIVNPYQYKGREWDAEARLHYMRARYYDPQLGRFLSEDPLGLAGGINPTAFVGGDPVNYSDPSGLLCTYVRERWDDHESGTHGFTPWRATACDLSDYGGGSFGYGQRPGFPTTPRSDIDHDFGALFARNSGPPWIGTPNAVEVKGTNVYVRGPDGVLVRRQDYHPPNRTRIGMQPSEGHAHDTDGKKFIKDPPWRPLTDTERTLGRGAMLRELLNLLGNRISGMTLILMFPSGACRPEFGCFGPPIA